LTASPLSLAAAASDFSKVLANEMPLRARRAKDTIFRVYSMTEPITSVARTRVTVLEVIAGIKPDATPER
jgi:hypothetical protein